MDALSALYAIVFHLATAVLVAGVGWRVWLYARTPAPLKIATTPAPLDRQGAALRVLREVALFESLFKSDKTLWVLAALFHAALALVLMRHLRYFTEPVWFWVGLVQPFGLYAAFAFLAGLAGLWARRLLIDRVRYISAPSDHLMLALLIAIGASGLGLKYLARTDIVALKAFFLGLMRFDWRPLPQDGLLLLHLALVAALMIIFPFSKLLHAPGVFFSPTRNQVDDPRERRHLAPWAAALDQARK